MKIGDSVKFKKAPLTGKIAGIKHDGRHEIRCPEYPVPITAEDGEIEHFDDTLAGQIWQSWGGNK